MAKRKSGKAAEDTTPPTPEGEGTPQAQANDANGGGTGSDPKWQRMQPPQQPAQPEQPAPETDAGADDPPPANDPQQPEGEGEGERMMTQAEVDGLIADRLKRERKKYADYKDLQAKAKKLDEIEREQMDEVERLKLEAQEARQQAEAAQQQATQQQINSAVMAEITAYSNENTTFRPDAIRAALRLVDLSEIEIDGDGNVAGVEEAVRGLANDHPYLLQQPTRATTPTSPTNPARTGPQGRGEAELRQKYFGGGSGSFFKAREENVVYPE